MQEKTFRNKQANELYYFNDIQAPGLHIIQWVMRMILKLQKLLTYEDPITTSYEKMAP